jgi:hypothetical protein
VAPKFSCSVPNDAQQAVQQWPRATSMGFGGIVRFLLRRFCRIECSGEFGPCLSNPFLVLRQLIP